MCVARWIQSVLSLLQPKGTTPLPWTIIAAVFVSMFSNAVTIQMLFAFLPDMVKSFGIADEDAGYYVGLLASSVFVGRFLSSYIWGWICDKIGRRKVLLWCLILMAITTISFGFAKSFVVAFVIRLLTGLVAGIAGTAKAVLTEICDDSNQPLGMSLVITAWNCGLIFGPAVGGFLARPADKYPLFKKGSLFDDFPYLLPCVVNTALLLLGFMLTFFKLPETLATLKKNNRKSSTLSENLPKDDEESVHENNVGSLTQNNHSVHSGGSVNWSRKGNNVYIDASNSEPSSQQKLLNSGSVSFLPDMDDYNMYKSLTEVDKVVPYTLSSEKTPVATGCFNKLLRSVRGSKLFFLGRNRDVRYTIGLYMMFSFAAVAEHEMYSVWAASGRNLGGLSFDTNDLGFTLMVVGICTALSGCIVFPRLAKCFGTLKALILCHFVIIFFIILTPATNILYERRTELKVAVIAVLAIIRIAQGCCFVAQFILIGNCVSSNYRATVHGLAMSMSSIARALSPTVAGSIFSWSVQSGLGFPFNEKCVYIFLSFITWLSLIIACCLNSEIEKRSD